MIIAYYFYFNKLFISNSATTDHKVTIWDAENGKRLKEISKNQALISSLEFSPSGSFLAIGSYDQSLLIIDSKVNKKFHINICSLSDIK